MTVQEIVDKTNTLNQSDFLNYMYKLQQTAPEKYNLSIFLQNFETPEKTASNSFVVERLFKKYSEQDNIYTENKKKEKPVLGVFRGMVEYIADDFNAPLDDLKDYMY